MKLIFVTDLYLASGLQMEKCSWMISISFWRILNLIRLVIFLQIGNWDILELKICGIFLQLRRTLWDFSAKRFCSLFTIGKILLTFCNQENLWRFFPVRKFCFARIQPYFKKFTLHSLFGFYTRIKI